MFLKTNSGRIRENTLSQTFRHHATRHGLYRRPLNPSLIPFRFSPYDSHPTSRYLFASPRTRAFASSRVVLCASHTLVTGVKGGGGRMQRCTWLLKTLLTDGNREIVLSQTVSQPREATEGGDPCSRPLFRYDQGFLLLSVWTFFVFFPSFRNPFRNPCRSRTRFPSFPPLIPSPLLNATFCAAFYFILKNSFCTSSFSRRDVSFVRVICVRIGFFFFFFFFFFPFIIRNNTILDLSGRIVFSYIFLPLFSSSAYLFYPLRIHQEQRKRISQEANDCFFETGIFPWQIKRSFRFCAPGEKWLAVGSRALEKHFGIL